VTFNQGQNGVAGTKYTIWNHTNGLVQYMYGDCGPIAAGSINPSQSHTEFVKAGTNTKMSFRGAYGASYCHCAIRTLTGSADKDEDVIILEYKDFCDHQ